MPVPNERTGEAAVSIFKAGSAWAAVGISSWSDFAAMLAALYSLILIGEWAWKKYRRKS